jgi:hypothetical protein
MKKINENAKSGLTKRAFIIGIIFSAYFAWSTVIRENRPPFSMMSVNALPVLPYVGLFFLALVINPILRFSKIIRAFTKGEMLMIFVMCFVTAGVATFGLVAPMVPIISGMNNRDNNNDQNQWIRYVMPYMNENYFISVKGTREAAIKYRDACNAYDKAKALQRSAKDIVAANGELSRIAKEDERIAKIQNPKLAAAEKRTLAWPRQQADKLLVISNEIFNGLNEGETPETVAKTYGDKIDVLDKDRKQLKETLYALNEKAFAEVDLIRKGFPDDKRAIPGFLYMFGEGWASYAARYERVWQGTEARDDLQAIADNLSPDATEGKKALDPAKLADEIEGVSGKLAPLSQIPAVEAREKKLSDKAEVLETKLEKLRAEVRELRHKRRYAQSEDFAEYDEKIAVLDDNIKDLDEETKAIRKTIEEKIIPSLAVCERIRGTQTSLGALATQLRIAKPADYNTIYLMLQDQISTFRSFDASYQRYFFGDIDWSLWFRPLINWLILGFLGYAIMMSFNTLIYRQWSHNEKLIYPIAEATTVLAEGGDPETKGKSIYKSGLFWFGFCIAAGVLGWNYLVASKTVPNISPIQLQTLWLNYVGGSIFSGMGSTYFCIIFAVIGLSFLVPSNISSSLWGFEVGHMVLLMVMAWLGYGHHRWSIGNHPRMFIGSGAVWIFGFVILWTCRNYIICIFRKSKIEKLPEDEKKELLWSSAIFMTSSVLLIILLVFRLDTSLYRAIKWFLMGIILTIAVVRAVCEGGILGMEGGLQPFPLGSGGEATNIPYFADAAPNVNLGIAGPVWGMKAFIAPIIANTLKMRDDIPIRRLYFHLAIWAGLIVAVFIAVVSLIILSYDSGANSLNAWLSNGSPKGFFTGIKNSVAASGTVSAAKDQGWWITGAILMSLLLYFRQKSSWIPHPIGLIMLINPVMFGFWGSIFIGWLFKSIASKYCTKDQYHSVRFFFIGLIVGHLFAAFMGWDIMNWHWG